MYRKLFTLLLLSFFAIDFGLLAKSLHAEEMNYFGPLTREESASIHYIINTLGTKSSFALLGYRKQLNEAGKKTNTVHPLRFWREVLTDTELKSKLTNIGSIPRGRLISDFSETFQNVSQQGQMKDEYIQDFSQKTGVSEKTVKKHRDNKTWKEFLTPFFS